jgi:iron complex outermembrane receptor protein
MKLQTSASIISLAVGLALSAPTFAQTAPPAEADIGNKLESVTVTAEKRVETVQTAPLAISAISGTAIAEQKVLTTEDLGHSAVGVSFTATSPQAQEINIRGVMNTRLTAPTADQSVSMFQDDVYVSRSGTMNQNFYDLDRIELVRGPQGVLMGKNVSGGAVNVFSAQPSFTDSGSVTVGVGNYDLRQAFGYVTGALTDQLAGRLSFQTIDHGGYAYDLAHGVPLENLDSVQARGQLLFKSNESDLRMRFLVEYSKDDSNGINRVPIASPNCLPGPCIQSWSNARAEVAEIVGGLNIRQSYPTWPTFAGDLQPTPQDLYHESVFSMLRVDKGVGNDITLTSVTGWRTGHSRTYYDQSGIGPDNPYGVDPPLLFSEPVYFQERVNQLSEELRLTSSYSPESKIDWIAGAYVQNIDVHQFNRFWGNSIYLPNLCGQSNWDDAGTSKDAAIFAQIGFKLAETWKLDVGARYTHDSKAGLQQGFDVSNGCPLNPTGTIPLTPLTDPAVAGTGYAQPYNQSWSKFTPQATLSWTPSTDVLTYLKFATGYKGGGFENDAASGAVAATPYEPETVNNYELGIKWTFLDGRARWNTAIFDEEYKKLQVEQTSGSCLCNIVNNASSAKIRGVETEFTIQATHAVRAFLNASYVSAKYEDFIDANGVVDTGHQLQRTPKNQISGGIETKTSVGSWPDALRFFASYKHQGKMYWAPDNYTWEDGYGLLDARLTLAPPDRPWQVSLWGKNLTGTDYRTSIIAILGDEISSFGAPRTFGAEFTTKF